MNVERLVAERQAAWSALEALVARAGRRPERLPPTEILELGRSYRAATADLALVRRSCPPADPARIRLEELVRRARGLVYDAEPKRGSIMSFFARDYWIRIAERPVLLVLAALGLLVPAVLGAIWAYADEPSARGFVPAFLGGPIEARGDGIPSDVAAAFSSTIFVNNIRVTLLSFAGGIIFGLGTGYIVLSNGALLGVLGGLVFKAGHGSQFVELVAPHGVLELSCIVACAAAGFRLGWAIVEPGPGPRGRNVTAEARNGVETVLGTMPWLVLAGVVEGFITPRQIGLGPALALGFGLGAVWWALLLWRGRPNGSEPRSDGADYSRARDLARR